MIAMCECSFLLYRFLFASFAVSSRNLIAIKLQPQHTRLFRHGDETISSCGCVQNPRTTQMIGDKTVYTIQKEQLCIDSEK